MHPPKLSNLLLIALSFTSTAQASLLKPYLANDQHGHGLVLRQASDDSSSNSDATSAVATTSTLSSSAPAPSTASTVESNTTPTSTASTASTASTRAPAPTSASTTTNTPAQTTAPSDSNNNNGNDSDTSTTTAANSGSSADNPAVTDGPTPTDGHATATEPVESTITQIITATNSAGVLTTYTSESVTTTTPTPDLQNSGSDDDGGSGGMSPETRNVVIGVVVGVGGAIVLGGLAYVLWRIYMRKKTTDDVDSLMPYHSGGPMGMEKSDAGAPPGGSGAGPAGSQFQNALERYHVPQPPAPRVNASSNF